MSKKIVMYILTSLVVTIITTVGSFIFKDTTEKPRVMLIIQHPDSCFLLEPSPLAAGMSSGADVVSVEPGKHVFKFDCEGKQIELNKVVKEDEHIWHANPTGQPQPPSSSGDQG